jgi:hypothetical protein
MANVSPMLSYQSARRAAFTIDTIKMQEPHYSAREGSIDCSSICRGVRFRRSGNSHVRPNSLLVLRRNR